MVSSFLKTLILLDIFVWTVLHVPVHRLVLINLVVAIWFNRKFLKLAIQTLPRDIKGVRTLLAVERALKKRLKEGRTIGTIFEDYVEKHPQKIAFVSLETGKTWTFAEFNQLTNQVANYFDAQGLRKGDVVALLSNNCPEYVAFWLGLSKIGVVTALINYNLRAEPLGHSIKISNAKCIIMAADFQKIVEEDTKKGYINSNLKRYVFGGDSAEGFDAENIMSKLQSASKLSPTVKDSVDFKSVLIYIYTSGTTGLPKACVITHARFFMLAGGTGISLRVKPDDKLYVIMPLYHTAAGILGVGQTLLSGCTSVVRKKFSSSRFWEECVEHQCTVSQYIGEICRYLLAQPYRPAEKQHKVRLMYGNGLRAQIWEDFVNRFHIDEIGEIYGSTEGNASLINLDSKVGACGFLPIYPYSSKRYPVRLVKVDPDTGELIRDENGLCVRCRPGEHGEMVGRVIKGSPLKDFIGYVSETDTNKKLVRDVFQKGDVAFCSGDILFMDEKGYVYFKDRTGDTFRWKGENVSTTEVEGVIQKVIGLNDATSYGVEIPSLEGRAGMVAIVDENQNTDLEELNKKIKEVLAPYARPVFLRLCREVETTGTYKLRKSDLQKASFDPTKCGSDKLFFLNSKTGHYEPLTSKVYEEICAGKITF